jgi:GH24 family phage-related lysozyme (muramidase)
MHATPEGWTLLKNWEGCRLSAYPDPASGCAPWTIGYGETGPDVVPGLTITQQQADTLLQQDVAHAASAVGRLLPGVALLPRQRDALISFCFNVGVGCTEGLNLAQAAVGPRGTSGGDRPGVAPLVQRAAWPCGRAQAPKGCRSGSC